LVKSQVKPRIKAQIGYLTVTVFKTMTTTHISIIQILLYVKPIRERESVKPITIRKVDIIDEGNTV